jgi:hypothetical protein
LFLLSAVKLQNVAVIARNEEPPMIHIFRSAFYKITMPTAVKKVLFVMRNLLFFFCAVKLHNVAAIA